jgi:glycosyltransferase involved in cell wall biosynthesis
MKKPKVLFHSCHSRQLSGFGKNCKNILKYLCSTGKYEIIEFANAYKWSDEELKTLPWKCIGSGPDETEIIIKNNENEIAGREMSYGLLKIDEVIRQEKPDIYIGAEDIWAFIKISQKPWWNKINCMLWTTLDSLPLLEESINIAKKTKHYYTWANFAKKECHKKNLKHVGCLHGAIDTSNFFKLPKNVREEIKSSNSISPNDFIIGFVFRNQLRKSVPNLLDGFKLFKEETKKQNVKLLLHTGWHEGWDINSLIKEKNIKQEDILTTYFCKSCNNYKITNFQGQEINCPHCGKEKGMRTLAVNNGPSEQQLNEIYNIMDVYCHPFTSGGQEIPIQEAKLCELITLSTNYSCGEDMNTKNSGGLPLSWSEYREPGTQFIKASTSPRSICNQLTNFLKMSNSKKEKMGKQARQFVIENYSTEAVGQKLEKILDQMPQVNFDFNFSSSEINPNYIPPNISDSLIWIKDLYKNMFSINLKPNDPALKNWRDKMNGGEKREDILAYLKNIAIKEKVIKNSLETFLEEIKNLKQEEIIAIVVEGNKYDTLLTMAAVREIQQTYPDKKIILITHPLNFDVCKNNPFIYKIINFFEGCNDSKKMEKEFVHICYVMPISSKIKDIYHHSRDKISEAIKNGSNL